MEAVPMIQIVLHYTTQLDTTIMQLHQKHSSFEQGIEVGTPWRLFLDLRAWLRGSPGLGPRIQEESEWGSFPHCKQGSQIQEPYKSERSLLKKKGTLHGKRRPKKSTLIMGSSSSSNFPIYDFPGDLLLLHPVMRDLPLLHRGNCDSSFTLLLFFIHAWAARLPTFVRSMTRLLVGCMEILFLKLAATSFGLD